MAGTYRHILYFGDTALFLMIYASYTTIPVLALPLFWRGLEVIVGMILKMAFCIRLSCDAISAILMLVGMIVGIWIASGTVPLLIQYGRLCSIRRYFWRQRWCCALSFLCLWHSWDG